MQSVFLCYNKKKENIERKYNMYQFCSRVRYSEVDQYKQLSLPSIINYFQDCSTFHSEEVGLGIDCLETTHHIWMLSSWQIEIERYPKFAESITVSTWAYDFKGIYGYRNFTLSDATNTICVKANSIWIYMDTKRQLPSRIPKEMAEPYGLDSPLVMDELSRKLTIPEELIQKEPFTVVLSNIDTNNHVNNEQYIEFAIRYLPPNFTIKKMCAQYKMSAKLGDTIIPHVAAKESCVTVVLTNTTNSPYAIVTFQ